MRSWHGVGTPSRNSWRGAVKLAGRKAHEWETRSSFLLAGKILGLGVEVEVDCLALFLVGMFVSLQLGM
jgi:hypothetical protein